MPLSPAVVVTAGLSAVVSVTAREPQVVDGRPPRRCLCWFPVTVRALSESSRSQHGLRLLESLTVAVFRGYSLTAHPRFRFGSSGVRF